MTFERDRVLMLRTSLAEERAHTDLIVQAVEEIYALDVAEYDNPIGYQSAVRTLCAGIVKRHEKKRDG